MIEKELQAKAIRAEVYSDDRVFEIEFDAIPWFEQASTKDIIRLAECEFGGDYPADEVARWFASSIKQIEDLFNYLDLIKDKPAKKDECGFECYINQADALDWLRHERHSVWLHITEEEGSNK